jgi:hypothetical protein
VGPSAFSQFEAAFSGQSGHDAKALQLEHSSERVGHRSVVVYYQDGARGLVGDAVGRDNHCIILMAKDMGRQGRARTLEVSLYNVAADTLELPVLFPYPFDILSRVEVT